MFHTLLVPLDGSPFSAKALPVAAALAKRTGATLHVVTVLDPTAYVPFVPGEVLVPVMDTDALEARRTADDAALQEEANRLRAEGITVVGRLLEGVVVDAIASYCEEINADLVVMTTHGRSGLQRLWLGSVAMSFLHRAPCPVYLVRPSGEGEPQAANPLPTGPMLVSLDGTRFGESIVSHATEFAHTIDVPITLFTVAIPTATPMTSFGTEALLADESSLTRQEESAEARLKKLAEDLPSDTTTDVATDLTAARAILAKAESCGAGVIAMATHGRTGLARLVMGSCADSVVRGAVQPILLYRPTKSEAEQASPKETP